MAATESMAAGKEVRIYLKHTDDSQAVGGIELRAWVVDLRGEWIKVCDVKPLGARNARYKIIPMASIQYITWIA